MSSFVDFSSWPREQEQAFVVFEQRAQESSTKAWMFGAISGAVMFVVMVGIYLGVSPEIKEMKGMNMSNLTKKKGDNKSTAPKAEDKPDETKPAETKPAETKPAETAPAEAPAKTE